jgi:hypothetical protein
MERERTSSKWPSHTCCSVRVDIFQTCARTEAELLCDAVRCGDCCDRSYLDQAIIRGRAEVVLASLSHWCHGDGPHVVRVPLSHEENRSVNTTVTLHLADVSSDTVQLSRPSP